MAIKSTIYKAQLDIADMDRHYYQSHSLTLAQHPSETSQRMMLRLAIFALHANESLSFTKGISTADEPDLWQKSLIDDIELWIDIGQITEERIRKACHKSQKVIIYSYETNSTQPWWKKTANKVMRFNNLTVYQLNCPDLAHMIQRNMNLQYTIEDGLMYISDGQQSIECTRTQLL